VTQHQEVQPVEMVPVNRINVMNPRVRNQRIFKEIAANIAEVGLKRPITVTRRHDDDGPRYELVCGQGRLEAYQALGQPEIPAVVIEASAEDCLIRSLVENCARRQHKALDLLQGIDVLKQRGYDASTIARKTGLSGEYVRGIIRLMDQKELRLLRAVELGQMPISVAIGIAGAEDQEIQDALQQAYDTKVLRGSRLIAVKRLVEQRRRQGKAWLPGGKRRNAGVSAASLVRVYRENVDRKRLLIRRADGARSQLTFVIEAMRKLLADANFVTLLRAERLESLPQNLAARIENPS
jgi:ParB family chromosome partitioning protein